MAQTETNKPADTIYFGGVKGVIWGNPGKDGKPTRYSVQYVRSYRTEDGSWRDTNSLGELDNLKIGPLYLKVADRIVELKSADRQAANAEEDEE